MEEKTTHTETDSTETKQPEDPKPESPDNGQDEVKKSKD